MARKYHTVCEYDEADGCWYDCCGFYSKADAQEELEALKADGVHHCIITHDDNADAMMAARDALPMPKAVAKRLAREAGKL